MSDLPPGYQLYNPQPLPEGYTLVDPATGKSVVHPEGGLNSPAGDFLYGMRKPIDTGATLLARGLTAVAPEGSGFQQWAQGQQQETAQATQQAAEAYKAARYGSPPAFSLPRIAGEMVTTAPLAYAVPGSTSANLFARAASNAGGGALTSLLTGDPNASPTELGSEALTGAALGTLAAPLTGASARVISPNTSPEVTRLMEAGVRPTPGQIMGGGVNRIEQALTSVPIVGDFIKSARARAGQQFNMGIYNEVLAPIGQTIEAAKPGREALVELGDKVSAAYNNVVPQAGGQLDAQAITDINRLQQLGQFLGPGRDQQFNAMLNKYVTSKISPNGSMTGESFKEAESDLGKEAAALLYNRNSTSDERQLGGALREAQKTLRDWLGRTNSEIAGDLQNANAAYARLLRVENAAARQGEEPGVFSPAQFQAAVKAYSTNRQYARGQGLMQDLSDAGRSVLGPTVPDSGTPLRHAAQLGIGALAGHSAGVPITPQMLAAAAAAGGTAGAIYNPVSQPLIAHLLASRYPWMRQAGEIVPAVSPLLASGLAAEQGGLLGR